MQPRLNADPTVSLNLKTQWKKLQQMNRMRKKQKNKIDEIKYKRWRRKKKKKTKISTKHEIQSYEMQYHDKQKKIRNFFQIYQFFFSHFIQKFINQKEKKFAKKNLQKKNLWKNVEIFFFFFALALMDHTPPIEMKLSII